MEIGQSTLGRGNLMDGIGFNLRRWQVKNVREVFKDLLHKNK